MKIAGKWIAGTAVVSLAVLLCMIFGPPVVQGSAADHVRWDIVSLNPATTPATLAPGGVAFAAARNPSTLTIKLTGSGTFIGPASGGTSGGVTGGGTWETLSGTPKPESGPNEEGELISGHFKNFKTGSFIN